MDMPEKLIAADVYEDGTLLVGVADTTLPDVEYLSESIEGAGVAGEMESITLGLTKALEITIKFRMKTRQAVNLSAPKSHHLEFRASQQKRTGEGTLTTVPERVVVRGMPKKLGHGKLEMGKPQDNELALSLSYYKVELNGETVMEIDKLNWICNIGGVDYLAPVRSDLGRES